MDEQELYRQGKLTLFDSDVRRSTSRPIYEQWERNQTGSLTDKGYQQMRLYEMNHRKDKGSATYRFEAPRQIPDVKPVDNWQPSRRWLSTIYPDSPPVWRKEKTVKPLRDTANQWIRQEVKERKFKKWKKRIGQANAR